MNFLRETFSLRPLKMYLDKDVRVSAKPIIPVFVLGAQYKKSSDCANLLPPFLWCSLFCLSLIYILLWLGGSIWASSTLSQRLLGWRFGKKSLQSRKSIQTGFPHVRIQTKWPTSKYLRTTIFARARFNNVLLHITLLYSQHRYFGIASARGDSATGTGSLRRIFCQICCQTGIHETSALPWL